MTTGKRSAATAIWDFFCSLKLAIVLLILLAITSIIGTVIPQGRPPMEYVQSISDAKFKFYTVLGFFDMYHSWWFLLLLYLFTLNLITCSIKRLPRVWKTVKEPTLVLDEGLERSLSCVHQFKVAGSPATLREQLGGFLGRNFAAATVTEQGGELHLFAQKTAWCRLGVYVVHLSIVVVFIGAIIGSLFGYKAFVQIPEGSAVDRVYDMRTEREIPLGFFVKNEQFSVSYYDNGAPKEFKSVLTVLDENGKPVIERRPTIVNDPLSFRGITFYQSSYGQADGGGSLFRFTVRPAKGGTTTPLALHQGEQTPLPGGGSVTVLESTQEVSQFVPQMSGAAARIQVTEKSGKVQPPFIVFQKYPNLDAERGGDLVFSYEGTDAKMWTGLQVAKDPGVWIVWSGCLLMVLGIYVAFFLSHRRVWVRIGHGQVVLAGSANKNPAAFEQTFADLVAKLQAELIGGKP